jgi:hypothetical protein
MPAYRPDRPHEERIPERIRTATSQLTILSSGSAGSVGDQLRKSVRGMPTQWATGNSLAMANVDGLARAAINNLNKLVNESPHINSFGADDRAATQLALTQLCKLCSSFVLAQPLSPQLQEKLDEAAASYRRHFCLPAQS